MKSKINQIIYFPVVFLLSNIFICILFGPNFLFGQDTTYRKYDTSIQTFSDLQDAIFNSEDGDSLFIAKGIYSSNCTLEIRDKNNLVIEFEPGASVICTDQFADVISMTNCQNTLLKNCLFKHSPFDLNTYCTGVVIKLVMSEYITIENCVIKGSGAIGVYGTRVKNIYINNCEICDNSEAAFCFPGFDDDYSRDIKVQYCNIYNNGRGRGNALFPKWCSDPNDTRGVNIIKKEKPYECKSPLDTVSTIEVIHFEEIIDHRTSYYFDVLKPKEKELPSSFQGNIAATECFLNHVSPKIISNLSIEEILMGSFDLEYPIYSNFLLLHGFESFADQQKKWDEFDAKDNQKAVIDTLVSIWHKYQNIFNKFYERDHLYTMRLPTEDGVFFPTISKNSYDFDNETIRISLFYRDRDGFGGENKIETLMKNYIKKHKHFPLSLNYPIPVGEAKKIFGGSGETYVETIIDLIPNSEFIENLYLGRFMSTDFNIIRITKNFYRENQYDYKRKCFNGQPVYQIIIESTN